MPNFWDRWKSFFDRISAVLVATCAISSILGGVELIELDGPRWVAALFILFGVGMLAAVLWSVKSRSSQP